MAIASTNIRTLFNADGTVNAFYTTAPEGEYTGELTCFEPANALPVGLVAGIARAVQQNRLTWDAVNEMVLVDGVGYVTLTPDPATRPTYSEIMDWIYDKAGGEWDAADYKTVWYLIAEALLVTGVVDF